MVKGTILVFGAHPDDMEIGAGGTLVKLHEENYDIYPVIGTVPGDASTVETRLKEAEESARCFSKNKPIILVDDPHQLDFNRKLIGKIDEIMVRIKPDTVFTHWLGDSHQDHIKLTQSVISASRNNDMDILMYERTIPGTITNASFKAQLFVDVTGQFEDKIKALNMHFSQVKKYGDKLIEALRGRAAYNGYFIGKKYAEVFEIIRIKKW
ncbi:MAG: PIG-L family deacetylase [Candidatus Aenigmarchaeota archaeon]|nr:PIG-L family deacetylase [Candidatus Aenigmarchaeota archaeon]